MLRFLVDPMHSVVLNQIFSKKFLVFLLVEIIYLVPIYSSSGTGTGLDSMLIKLESEIPEAEKAELMMEIAGEYYYTNIQEAIRFASQANEMFRVQNNKTGIGKSLNMIGAGYYALGNYAEAEVHFQKALGISRQSYDSVYTAKILSNLANIKLNTGRLLAAIDYFSEAGEIFSKIKNAEGAIAIENSLSSIYRSTGSYSKAHIHLENAISLAEENQNHRMLGTIYHNLGALLIEEGKYKEALQASLKSYSIRIAEGHLAGQIKCLINLGSIYHETNKDFESDTCYNKALLLAKKYAFVEDEAYILMHLGYLNLENSDFQNASGYFSGSMRLAEDLCDLELQVQLHDYMFYIDSVQGNFKSAVLHMQQYNNLRSELDISGSEKKLEELENMILLAREENILKDNIIHRNQTLINCLIAGLIILVLITMLVIQQVLLRSQRKIAELSQENLRSQMNPHFIFNILNSIHSFMLKKDADSSSKYLLKFSQLLRLTLDNSRSKLVTINDEINALKLYLELESMRFENQLEYKIIIDEEIDPLMFKIPTLLLQPYVENSILHGFQGMQEKGKIEIRMDYKNNAIHCSIKDNGIGRKKAESIKREKGIIYKSHGSNITETRLKLLNKIYGRKFGVMYTELLDKDDNCRGTKVEFDLPILN